MSLKLKPKHQRFAEEYCVDMNSSAAAVRAGYTARSSYATGPRLFAEPAIKAEIDALMAKKGKLLLLTAANVLEGVMRVTQKAEDVGELSNALKGFELQGKHLKLFTDKTEHSGSVGINVIDPYAKPEGE